MTRRVIISSLIHHNHPFIFHSQLLATLIPPLFLSKNNQNFHFRSGETHKLLSPARTLLLVESKGFLDKEIKKFVAESRYYSLVSNLIAFVNVVSDYRLGRAQVFVMEFFKKAKAVRFRSHHDKYLLAGDDGESIWQDRDGYVKNARWMVEMNVSGTAIRLKSCYGKYLTASNMPGLLGMKSKKVVQTLPKTLDSTVEWEPIREEGFKVKLKMAGSHDEFLRANGGVPPWRNSITHDTARRKLAKEWMLWDVDVVEIVRAKKTMPDGGDLEQWESCSSSSENDDMTSLPTKQNSESKNSEVCDDPHDKVVVCGSHLKSDTSEMNMTPLPAKLNSDGKERKVRRGESKTNAYSMFTMCTCSPPVNDMKGSIVKKNHKKGSKRS